MQPLSFIDFVMRSVDVQAYFPLEMEALPVLILSLPTAPECIRTSVIRPGEGGLLREIFNIVYMYDLCKGA